MCVAFCFFSFACSPVTMSTTQYSSGEILVEIEFDISTLSGTQKNKAFKLAEEYHKQVTNAYKENLVGLFDNIYKDNENWAKLTSTEDKFTIIKSAYPRFIACYKDAKVHSEYDGGAVLTDSVLTESATILKVEIAFTTIYAYLAYFCPSAYQFDEESKNIVIDSEIYSTLIDTPVMVLDSKTEDTFFAKQIIETCSPFYYNKEQPKLLENYKTYVAGASIVEVAKTELGLTDEEASFVFSFTTPYSRVHSNGTIESVENGTKHTWTFDNIDGQATIYRNYANQIVYYLIAIGVGVAVMLVAVVLSFIKAGKDKKILQQNSQSGNPDKEDKKVDTQSNLFDLQQNLKNSQTPNTQEVDNKIETPKKVRTARTTKKKDVDSSKETKSNNKEEKSTTNKTRKRSPKNDNIEKDVQDMTGIELLKAIDDLVRGDDDEEK